MEIKDKPASMSVREWITKKLAIKIVVPEKVIRQVITHQFDSAYDALKVNNSLEISGFGKFFYNTKKADKEIEWSKKQKAVYERNIEQETTEGKRIMARERYAKESLKLERLIKKKINSGGD